jgi:hypothetical protein
MRQVFSIGFKHKRTVRGSVDALHRRPRSVPGGTKETSRFFGAANAAQSARQLQGSLRFDF